MREKERKAIPAGDFSSWLRRFRQAQQLQETMEVPCGSCRACCTSSYFIHIGPGETRTLARIPRKLLFPAPGLPKGHVVMGYDEKGHCPMFADNECSIYEDRPQTCRDYDCRVFPASGLSAGDNKPLISAQAERWRFSFPADEGRRRIDAAKRAARFLRKYASLFPGGFVPQNPTQQAVVALKVHEVFLEPSADPAPGETNDSIKNICGAVVDAYKRFEKGENV